MKVTLYGKEYELDNIDCIKIGEKIIGIDKKCWLEVVENGVATKIEGTNSMGKASTVDKLKRIMELLKDKGWFVIDSKKDFLINIEKAEKIEFYENLSLLGKKYFLRVKLNGQTFDTMHTYNKKRYESIEENFRKRENEKIKSKIEAIHLESKLKEKFEMERKNSEKIY